MACTFYLYNFEMLKLFFEKFEYKKIRIRIIHEVFDDAVD